MENVKNFLSNTGTKAKDVFGNVNHLSYLLALSTCWRLFTKYEVEV